MIARTALQMLPPDDSSAALPSEVFVVCCQQVPGRMAAHFVDDHRHQAMQHALDCSGRESAESFRPFRVARYVLAELADRSETAPIPEGWKLVPPELTEKMRIAAYLYKPKLEARTLYRALLDAAPQPSTSQSASAASIALRRLLACIDDCKGHGTPIIKDRAECYAAMAEAEAALK